MLFELLLNGLVEGSLLALIAVGYSLAYGTARVINFAHADVMIAGGGYLVLLWIGAGDGNTTGLLMALLFGIGTYFATLTWFSDTTWRHSVISLLFGAGVFGATLGLVGRLPFAAAALLAVPFTALLADGIYGGGYLPLLRRRAARTSVLLSALGISIALESYLLVAWGSQRRVFPVGRVPPALSARPIPAGVAGLRAAREFGVLTLVGGQTVPVLDGLIVLVFLAVVSGLALFFRASRTADAMVAAADAPSAARTCGIPVERVLGQAFFLGGAVASLGGTLYVLRSRSLDPTAGFSPGLLAFAACVLGGVGSLRGSIAGAFVSGVVMSLAPAVPLERWARLLLPASWLPFLPSLNLSDWSYGIVYILMIGIILLKPEGLFRR
ncbi:MAG TPA: branched-chain amino acid ABC transporter permease [Thermoanaerobaculia bacterium]|nr:branched-chain amino acid ABC transporter permease [Thermoanaerobaculia bacterium]